MKSTTVRTGTSERQVIVAMITHKTFLATIASRWKRNLFPSPWANIIAGWCVEHVRKYDAAPQLKIRNYFEEWATRDGDKDTISLVEQLLLDVSQEHQRSGHELDQIQYLLDKAQELFDGHSANDLGQQLQVLAGKGDVKTARELIEGWRRVEVGVGTGIKVLSERAAWDMMFEESTENLIEYPDALGNFYKGALVRDCFISYMGKEKIGKSYILQDNAWNAVKQRRKVAYFEIGDSSQSQVLSRFAVRICGRPFKEGRYDVPTRMEPSSGGRQIPAIERKLKTFKTGICPEQLHEKRLEFLEEVGDNWRLSCHPNSSISVTGIASIVETWQRDDWTPDVLVIDYADILAPLSGKDEKRDQINESWKAMRALSQKLHCLVITATQTDTDSYSAWILNRGNFSEDKRKYAHVNGMIGINQTDDEKKQHVYRLNWVALRALDFQESKCCWCVGEMGHGNPFMLSTF